jgi:hypothetical protein
VNVNFYDFEAAIRALDRPRDPPAEGPRSPVGAGPEREKVEHELARMGETVAALAEVAVYAYLVRDERRIKQPDQGAPLLPQLEAQWRDGIRSLLQRRPELLFRVTEGQEESLPALEWALGEWYANYPGPIQMVLAARDAMLLHEPVEEDKLLEAVHLADALIRSWASWRDMAFAEEPTHQ